MPVPSCHWPSNPDLFSKELTVTTGRMAFSSAPRGVPRHPDKPRAQAAISARANRHRLLFIG